MTRCDAVIVMIYRITSAGWFELMSVDGRTAPVMSSVRQLVDVFPERFLVRKTISVMSADDALCRNDGARSRRVSRGELLTPVRVTGQRLLQCRDEKGCDVYLPLNQRGLFSAINGQTAANVYTLKSLLVEFRLPIIVRLVYGSLPIRDTSCDLRLVGIQTDHVTFVLPLRHAWTSNSVDRRALVAVPSKQASRLMVAAAARDFYYQWAMSDDGLELKRRCSEIVASWKISVHVVSSTITAAAAAAAAAAASTTAPSRTYEGDYATWSRGPMINSLDSGLASSASSPSIVHTGDTVCNDHEDEVLGHLEQEIDDIYAMIRYGADGVARLCRARSLDDCVSGGELFSKKPMREVRGSRRPSADVPRVVQKTTPITLRLIRREEPAGFYDVARSSSPVATMKLSPEQDVDNVQLISFRSENDINNADDDALLWLDHNSRELATSADCLPEAHAVVSGQPHLRVTAEAHNCDELTSTTPNPRRRSKSLPEVTCPTTRGRQDGKSHKSVLGTFTRSIANVFRRIRLHKEPRMYTVDSTNFRTFASERYSRRTHDDNYTINDIVAD